MIIGINGKIGHGKDTVGKIIQYLTLPGERGEYIGFQTYDDFTLERNSPFKIKKFAGKLKQIASLLTGIPVEMFEDQEFKKQYMPEEWNTDFTEVEDKYAGRMTYREFLQRLGTEAMRDGLHTNVWVNALFADYKDVYIGDWGQGNHMYEKPNWIITDMRFPNEMEAVKDKGGITIRVVRQYSKEDLLKGSGSHYIKDEELSAKLRQRYKSMADLPVVNIHPSETALDDAEFDYEIINDGTLEDLIEKVKEILIKEKLI
jgi:hypothetical protein